MMECTFSNGADGESRVAARFGLDDESVCVGNEDTWDGDLLFSLGQDPTLNDSLGLSPIRMRVSSSHRKGF